MPTCTAWRSMCRFQKPSSASSLNPLQNTHFLAESAFMMIRQFISKSHIHPSRALSLSGPYSRVYAKTVSSKSKQGHPSCQPVLPWVQTCYPQSTGLLGAELIWCKACLELHACISSEWYSVNIHIFKSSSGEERQIWEYMERRGGRVDHSDQLRDGSNEVAAASLAPPGPVPNVA